MSPAARRPTRQHLASGAHDPLNVAHNAHDPAQSHCERMATR